MSAPARSISSCRSTCPSTARIRSAIGDRKSTRLNSSHLVISYAVFCLKKQTRPYAIPGAHEDALAELQQMLAHRTIDVAASMQLALAEQTRRRPAAATEGIGGACAPAPAAMPSVYFARHQSQFGVGGGPKAH